MKDFEASIGLEKYKGQQKTAPLKDRNYLRFAPITDSDMTVLESRDSVDSDRLMPKKPLAKIVENFAERAGVSISRTALRVSGIDVGYAMSGIYQEGQRNIGEIAVVRVSPHIRSFGAGSALMNHELIAMLSQGGVDTLRLHVADRTGRVSGFGERNGLEVVSRDKGLDMRNTIMERVLKPSDADEILDRAQVSMSASLNRLAANEGFWSKLPKVESDDPLAVDFEKEVLKGPFLSNNRKPSKGWDVVYAGHVGGRIRIALVNAGEREEAVEIYVKGPDSQTAQQLLGKRVNGFILSDEDFGLGKKYGGVILKGKVGDQPVAIEDLGPMTKLSVDLTRLFEAEKYVGG